MSTRIPTHSIAPQFLDRWSPRAFTGEAVSKDDLLKMLEAARWSPSANNIQPWRFSYAVKGDAHWETFLGFLVDGNRAWAQQTGALVVVISKTHSTSPSSGEVRPNRTHSFDTGAAALALQLEANALGFHAHPMAGIHADKIQETLAIPAEGYAIEAMIAVGRKADPESLPDALKAREVPTERAPLDSIAFHGRFTG